MATSTTQRPFRADRQSLEQKARLLSDSLLFSSWGPYPSVQKQLIFLVLAGLKPAATVISSRDGRPDDPNDVAAFLRFLGLKYWVKPDRYRTEAYIALSPEPLNALITATDDYSFGLAAGFPRTAVEAWKHGTLLPHDEEAQLYHREGVEGKTDFFRLSRTHADQELAVLRSWWQVLEEYELA